MLERFFQNRETLLRILKSGNIPPEERDNVYHILTGSFPDDVKFSAYTAVKKNKNLLDIQKLAEALKLSPSIVKTVFTEKPVKVKFPVASADSADTATAHIFHLKEPADVMSFSNSKEKSEALQTIKNLTGRNFFAVFDKEFIGKSFMLAVTAGLVLPPENIENYAFSAVLNQSGELLPAHNIEQKIKICQTKGLKLITAEEVENINQLIYYLGEDCTDVPFLYMVNRPDSIEVSLKKLEKQVQRRAPHFSLEKLSKILDINKEIFSINFPKALPELSESQLKQDNIWMHCIKQFESSLKKIYSKPQHKRKVLHTALSIPASLAFGLGIKLGARKPVVIYHYQSDEYFPVLDLSQPNRLRQIKTVKPLNKLNIIELSFTENRVRSKKLAVSVWTASHNPEADIERFLSKTDIDSFLKIRLSSNQGNLPVDNPDIWIETVSEIYSAVNEVKHRLKAEELHLFFSTAVPTAFALGMAVGHFWKGTVYNYSPALKDSYYPVFNLHDIRLRSIF